MFEKLKSKIKKIKNLGRKDNTISLTGGGSPIKEDDIDKLEHRNSNQQKSGWVGFKWRF